MGNSFGDVMKVAIPVAIGAGAIIASGGTATPAVVGGLGAGETLGAIGLGGADVAVGTDLAMGGLGTLGVSPAWGGMPMAGGTAGATGAGGSGLNWQQGLNNFTTAAVGGNMLSGMLGMNQPRQPFQMGSAQAPSPVGGGGGGFQPTSQAPMAALANRMAQRRQQGPPRFGVG